MYCLETISKLPAGQTMLFFIRGYIPCIPIK